MYEITKNIDVIFPWTIFSTPAMPINPALPCVIENNAAIQEFTELIKIFCATVISHHYV